MAHFFWLDNFIGRGREDEEAKESARRSPQKMCHHVVGTLFCFFIFVRLASKVIKPKNMPTLRRHPLLRLHLRPAHRSGEGGGEGGGEAMFRSLLLSLPQVLYCRRSGACAFQGAATGPSTIKTFGSEPCSPTIRPNQTPGHLHIAASSFAVVAASHNVRNIIMWMAAPSRNLLDKQVRTIIEI